MCPYSSGIEDRPYLAPFNTKDRGWAMLPTRLKQWWLPQYSLPLGSNKLPQIILTENNKHHLTVSVGQESGYRFGPGSLIRKVISQENIHLKAQLGEGPPPSSLLWLLSDLRCLLTLSKSSVPCHTELSRGLLYAMGSSSPRVWAGREECQRLLSAI